MKEVERLIKDEETINLLNQLAELNKCIEAKCYTTQEEKIKQKELKEGLKRVKEIMKGGK